MTKAISEIKNTTASLMVFGKKRIAEIRAFAKTKFGNSLIIVKVNQEEERFDVIVQDHVKQTDINEFEQLWTMCKVLKAK